MTTDEGTAPDRLTESEIHRGRHTFVITTVLKDISLKLLGPSIITLYALRLGAGSALVGFLRSLSYLPFAFIFLGKVLVSRFGAVRIRGTCSFLRYFWLAPILLTALPAVQRAGPLPLVLIAICVFASRAAWQMGSAAFKPIQGELAGKRDPGSFLSRIQLLRSGLGVFAGLAMASILGKEAPIFRYSLFFAGGVFIGLIASWLTFRLPEPRESGAGFRSSLWPSILAGLRRRGFRRYISLQFLRKIGTSMVLPFMIVYFKRIYSHPDSHIIIFTVAGGLGSMAVSYLASRLADRVGVKPLLLACSFLIFLLLIPMSVTPGIRSAVGLWVFPVLMYFLFFFGMTGFMVCERIYFFASVAPEGRLNLGIASSITVEIAGVIGSLLGGIILQGLSLIAPAGESGAFRIYFGGLTVLFLVVGILMGGLPRKGAFMNPSPVRPGEPAA